ncbi:hypothetical protein F4561_000581 [Lipingzhangella halophila]|uniref:Uncharacterized protein n=1 Tax=Lipingzhangella halophila TaxID=1783352 RepID=A0A7W7W0L8_9ACTN|nr:hypothetical protein [Lipingzhangella halophila]MBB4929761.1 hypothetical protein [Lipingzhangella halophila]
MTILVITTGSALLVTALGFLVAVSIRIKLDDRRRAYRSLRYEDRGGKLSNSGRRLSGLSFPHQPAVPAAREPRDNDGEGEDGTVRQDRTDA